MLSELDVFGQCVAIMELPPDTTLAPGNTMQFCLHLGAGNADKIHKAYAVLKDDAEIFNPPEPCPFSTLMFGLIDKFGASWCVFE